MIQTTIGRFSFVRVAIVVFGMVLFSSCIGVEADIELQEDGSGEITLSYRVSHIVARLGKLDDDGKFLSVPLNRDDFDRVAAVREGLEIRSVSVDEDAENVYVDARIAFASVEDLQVLFGGVGGTTIQVTQNADEHVFRHVVFEGANGPPDDDAAEMMNALFADYNISYRLTVPETVRAAVPGTASDRTAEVAWDVVEIVRSPEPVVWRVTW